MRDSDAITQLTLQPISHTHPAAPCAGTSDGDRAGDMAKMNDCVFSSKESRGYWMPSPSSQRGDCTAVNAESYNFVRLAMHIIL